jgi:hypothetical protein
MLVNLFELSIDMMNPTFKGFSNSLDVKHNWDAFVEIVVVGVLYLGRI